MGDGSSVAQTSARNHVAAALMLACVGAYAQKPALQPGEYLESDGGNLTLKPGTSGELAFKIQTFGSNFTACNAEATIARNNVAVLRVVAAARTNLRLCREQGAKPK